MFRLLFMFSVIIRAIRLVHVLGKRGLAAFTSSGDGEGGGGIGGIGIGGSGSGTKSNGRPGPPVPAEGKRYLDFLQNPEPISPGELGLYVPNQYRSLGRDWIFTRGGILTRTERRYLETFYPDIGTDESGDAQTRERVMYEVLYAYYDHNHQLQTFKTMAHKIMFSVEMRSQAGNWFIVCFDRRSPRTHHVFVDLYHSDQRP